MTEIPPLLFIQGYGDMELFPRMRAYFIMVLSFAISMAKIWQKTE